MNKPLVKGRDDFAIIPLITKLALTESLFDWLILAKKLHCLQNADFSGLTFSSLNLPL